jgi:hypothetical protein
MIKKTEKKVRKKEIYKKYIVSLSVVHEKNKIQLSCCISVLSF